MTEISLIVTLNNKFTHSFTLKGVETSSVWIGGTDALVEGKWQWIPSGDQILTGDVYTSWQPGEPNGYSKQGEDCMAMAQKYGYKWNDNNCGNHQNFVCESR